MESLAILAHAYGLSARQATLVQALVDTGALRSAAAQAGVSYAGARNTLAELKAKFGIAGTPMLIGHLAALLTDDDPSRPVHHDLFDLTPRQYAIARALGVAQDRAEIARVIGVSPAVIDAELKQIYLVLGANGAGEVVRLVAEATGDAAIDEEARHALPDARLAVAGRTVAWSDYGPREGRPVLILHSTIAARAPPTRLVEALRARGFRPLAIDRPGFGDTDMGAGPPYAQAAADVAAVAAQLGIARLDVIARGSGQAAMVLAREQPALIGRVVLVNPTPHIDWTPVDQGPLGAVKRGFARRPRIVEAMIRTLAAFATPQRMRDGMMRSFRGSAPDLALARDDPRFVADYLRATRGFARGRLAGYVAEQVGWASGFDVARAPGMSDWRIVQGRHFILHEPDAAIAYWRERLPDTPVRWVEDAGQMLAYSHAGTVVDALVD